MPYPCFVLRPEDNDGPGIGQPFEISPHSFDDSSGQYVGSMCWELHNIFGYFMQQKSCVCMLVSFRHSLDGNDVGMQNG